MTGFVLTPCYACGFIVENMSAVDERRGPPSPGSLMICIACGAISILDEGSIGLFMRPPTPDEHRRALADPVVVRTLAARAILERRAGSEWEP